MEESGLVYALNGNNKESNKKKTVGNYELTQGNRASLRGSAGDGSDNPRDQSVRLNRKGFVMDGDRLKT